MKTSIRLVVVVALAFGVVLAACSPSAPASTPEAQPQPATSEPNAYPAPQEAYPPPAQAIPAYNPYPGPSEGVTNYIEWSAAESAILAGQVAQVYQADTMHVTLVLKDGSVQLAKEPALDEVFKVIDTCGDACKDIQRNP
jgi:hypothetical protein